VFLFTDSHVKEESFLEAINNMLTIGIVPAIFSEEENKNEMISTIGPRAKKNNIIDTPQNKWQYFRDTIKSQLHLVLCMSPAGSQLRLRCRDFPGLISSVIIDWYFSWPKAALLAVAEYALDDTKLPEDHRENIYKHMVKVHYGIAEYSEQFFM
jgi:dynein heavy chain